MQISDIIRIWVDHPNKVVSGVCLSDGTEMRFYDWQAFYAFCETAVAESYRFQ